MAAEPAFDDLTARARIRQAALAQFGEVGFERATIRSIAAAAGVSPGLVRHHFGSKQALREVVDAHVIQEIRRINDEMVAGRAKHQLGPSAVSRDAVRPFQSYLLRAVTEGPDTAAALFDQMVEPTEEWIAFADETRSDPPLSDRRDRAAVLTAMALGVPLLHEHLSRVLGVDVLSPEGDRRLAMALLDLYSHALVTTEFAAAARAALEETR